MLKFRYCFSACIKPEGTSRKEEPVSKIPLIRHFSNPDSWHDYVAAVLEIVPPVNHVLKFKHKVMSPAMLLLSVMTSRPTCTLPKWSNIWSGSLTMKTIVKDLIKEAYHHHCQDNYETKHSWKQVQMTWKVRGCGKFCFPAVLHTLFTMNTKYDFT